MTEDKDLLVKIRKGDLTAFNKLMMKYEDFVYSVCYNHIKDHQLAEESAQDTFLKVYRYSSSFKGGATVKTWIYRIAQRSSLDQLRKIKRYRYQEIDGHMIGTTHNEGEQKLESDERSQLVNSFLDVLDDRSRSVVEMFYLHQRKIEEIAAAMSMEISNVKIVLFRARKKMRESRNLNSLTVIE